MRRLERGIGHGVGGDHDLTAAEGRLRRAWSCRNDQQAVAVFVHRQTELVGTAIADDPTKRLARRRVDLIALADRNGRNAAEPERRDRQRRGGVLRAPVEVDRPPIGSWMTLERELQLLQE